MQTVHVGGKGCNNQPAGGVFGKKPVKRFRHYRLAHSISLPLDIKPPAITVGANDTIIISASPIPGNERGIYSVINKLYHLGADVV